MARPALGKDELSDLDDDDVLALHRAAPGSNPGAPGPAADLLTDYNLHSPTGPAGPQAPAAYDHSASEPPPVGQSGAAVVQNLKTKGMGLASYLRDKTVKASAGIKARAADLEWRRDRTTGSAADGAAAAGSASGASGSNSTLARMQTNLRGAAERVSTAAAEGSAYLWQASKRTTEVAQLRLHRWMGGPLVALCKEEAAAAPCPRLVLVCCTVLAAGAPPPANLFSAPAPPELVQFLLDSFMEGHGLVLPPAHTSPAVLGGVLAAFLRSLPEPLLTFALVPQFLEAGGRDPPAAAALLPALPPASAAVLQLVTEVAHRAAQAAGGAAQAAAGSGDERGTVGGEVGAARELARALAPLLAWHAPPREAKLKLLQGGSPSAAAGQAAGAGGAGAGLERASSGQSTDSAAAAAAKVELRPEERAALALVLEYFILHHPAVYGPPISPPPSR